MGEGNFYITTPIFYVNDSPHIGHAYTTILADVLSRYHRLFGEETHFLTGTDEHGLKVQNAAQKRGVTPQEHCDQFVKRFQELWTRLGISNDDFIRTTEMRHKEVVTKVLQDLKDRDLIYQSEYEGWYCVPCERYFMEKDLVDGCCPDCHRPVQRLVEKNYFFRMSRYQQQLIDYINEHPDFIQPANRRTEILGFLRQPLGDLCISRAKSRLTWGIELPFDHDYVTYVWVDALVNYISAIGYLRDDAEFRKWWPVNYHLIGKDILTTHAVYWTTMLFALGLPQPKSIFAHGWWLIDDSKMSKSVGNVVSPMDMADKYGIDALRYYLMAQMTLGQDANFSELSFCLRFNADLANNLGNLLSRVVTMLHKNCGGRIPAAQPLTADENDLTAACRSAAAEMRAGVLNMQLDRGLASIMAALNAANRYFDTMKPWALAKEGRTQELERVLRNTGEALRLCAELLTPVMPSKMAQLRTLLGASDAPLCLAGTETEWFGLQDGAAVGQIETPLFPRIDLSPELKAQLNQMNQAAKAKK